MMEYLDRVKLLDESIKLEVNEDTFWLQEGQYIVPSDGNTFLLESDSGKVEQYIISPISEGSDAKNKNNADQGLDILQYSQDEINNVSEEDTFDVSDETNSNFILQDFDKEEFQQVSNNYQFAILKDGKLHLQTINIVDSALRESDDILDKQLIVLQKSIDLDCNGPVEGLDKVTGKNLITGQVVTLDRYFDELEQKSNNKLKFNKESAISCLKNSKNVANITNKKIAVGKTVNGKKLFGKILHITQSNKNKLVEYPKIIEQDKSKKPRVIIKKHLMTRENFHDAVGKTLNGLMNLDTIRRKMGNKNLVVKLIEKAYDNKSDLTAKMVSFICGCMEERDNKWNFVLYNEKSGDDVLRRFDETCFLTIQMTLDKFGKSSTRVNLNEGQTNVECYICKKKFKNALQTHKHLRNVHFSDKQLLPSSAAQAQQKNTNERWYRCIKCSKSFGTAGSLKRHLTVHDPSSRPLECSVCTQRFTDESSLRKHLLIHTGIRSFACDVCNRTFVNQGDLNFHKRIHDPLKQFACSLCNRDFSRYSNLMRHTEIHRGVGALHKCDICGCSYSFVSSLTRHIVQKHIGQQKQ